jgi:ribosome-binding protein aMBF1 (putative translation factor)
MASGTHPARTPSPYAIKKRKSPVTEKLLRRFGDRVIEFRNEREWRQKHLAGTAGADQGYISGIGSGQTEPCLWLATLAKAFGLGLSELLKGVQGLVADRRSILGVRSSASR